MVVVRIDSHAFTPVRSGIYKVKLTKIEECKGIAKQDAYKFKFEIQNGLYRRCMLDCIINKSSTAIGGKLWQAIRALQLIDPVVGVDIDLDTLIGRECFIHVEKRGKSNVITEFASYTDIGDLESSYRKGEL